MTWYQVLSPTGTVLVPRVRWANDFVGRLLGLMFRRSLPADEGLVLVYNHESRMDTSIHMFFVPFPIAAIFVDRNFVVVDTVLAKPWRPFYAASRPAQYVLEADPALLALVKPGDTLVFQPGA